MRKRRPVNLYLSADLVAEAKRYGLAISRACEAGLIEEIDIRLREKHALQSAQESTRVVTGKPTI